MYENQINSSRDTKIFLSKRTLLIFVIIFIIHLWFITFGTWNLFALTPYGDNMNLWNGVCYDSLAKSLLHGKSTVGPSTILWEAFIAKGNTSMYFGPFPAFIRVVLNLAFPFMYGKWSRISCLVASAFCLLAFLQILRIQLSQNQYLIMKDKLFLLDLSLLSFGLGTPLLVLMTHSFVYHEAIIWGLCWCLWGLYFTISFLFLDEKKYLKILGLSFCAGFALLSRVSFGVPCYLTLLILTFKPLTEYLFNPKNRLNNLSAKIPLLLLPALLALCSQLWYNYDRFGSITDFLPIKYHLNYAVLKAPENVIDPKRIAICLINFFGFRKEYFSNKPPFIVIPHSYWPNLKNFFTGYGTQSISYLVISPWLVLGSILGLFLLFTSKKMLLAKLCGICYLSNWYIVCSFPSIVQRYANEFLPFMIFMYAYFLLTAGRQAFYKNYRIEFKLITIIICSISITTTLLSVLGLTLDSIYPEEIKNQAKFIFNFIENIIILIR